MSTCYSCRSKRQNTFRIFLKNGRSFEFDCFECAIRALAPHCQRCGLEVLDRGIEVGESIFCGVPCAWAEAFPEDIAPSPMNVIVANETG